jgi:hypothetical protein
MLFLIRHPQTQQVTGCTYKQLHSLPIKVSLPAECIDQPLLLLLVNMALEQLL